jgi:hypothetical protein
MTDPTQDTGSVAEEALLAPGEPDSEQKKFGFGPGGVPWYLLLFYLAFLVFFTWYVLEFQLSDYLEQGPGHSTAVEAQSP